MVVIQEKIQAKSNSDIFTGILSMILWNKPGKYHFVTVVCKDSLCGGFPEKVISIPLKIKMMSSIKNKLQNKSDFDKISGMTFSGFS